MADFPYSKAEWARVSEAARTVLNATFADDKVLRASGFAELRRVLSELRQRYGEHPVLLETEADFTDEPYQRVRVYHQAIALALASGWPTYSIRISLARVLLEDIEDAWQASHELSACRAEVATRADDYEREQWEELQAGCAARMADSV